MFDNRMETTMTLDQIERSLERLRSRLYRTVNKINKLEKAQKRLKQKQAEADFCHCAAEPKPHKPHRAQPRYEPATLPQAIENNRTIAETKSGMSVIQSALDDLTIPAALKRTNAKDEAVKAEILTQQEAAKKIKTQARISKLKAAKAGDTKRMPLQGKAALAKIREGC